MRIGLIIRVRSFLIKGKEREMVIVGKLFGKTWLFDTLVEIAGSILTGVAIYNFALPAKFPMTGFSGLALILYRLFDLPIGVMTIVLNIPVAILCYRVLGRRFFLCSVRCMILSSLFVDYIAPMLPQYTGERLVAAICAGVLGGLGYALIYMRNSSTGGADFITMALKAKHPHLPLGRFIMLTDGIVVVLGGIIFRDFDGIVYGMMIDLIFAVIADKIMYGANAGKLALIVTDHGEAVTEPDRRALRPRHNDHRRARRLPEGSPRCGAVRLLRQGDVHHYPRGKAARPGVIHHHSRIQRGPRRGLPHAPRSGAARRG